MTAPRIGVFDSGIGGLSVLHAVRRRLPSAALHYVADSGHAPYGERDDAYVVARSERIASRLVAAGSQALVVACNTATAAAVASLRSRWPELAVVGVEPGIKPALVATRKRRIGVMATGSTLHSRRFAGLLERHGSGATFHLQACTGLAAAIENGHAGDSSLAALIERHTRPLREAQVDVVVLGCTHYVFVVDAIRAALGDAVAIVDTAEAVARQVGAVVAACIGATGDVAADRCGGPAGAVAAAGSLRLESSGDPELLRRFAAEWLGYAGPVVALPAEYR